MYHYPNPNALVSLRICVDIYSQVYIYIPDINISYIKIFIVFLDTWGQGRMRWSLPELEPLKGLITPSMILLMMITLWSAMITLRMRYDCSLTFVCFRTSQIILRRKNAVCIMLEFLWLACFRFGFELLLLSWPRQFGAKSNKKKLN